MLQREWESNDRCIFLRLFFFFFFCWAMIFSKESHYRKLYHKLVSLRYFIEGIIFFFFSKEFWHTILETSSEEVGRQGWHSFV